MKYLPIRASTPVLPQFTVMVDRADGKQWALVHHRVGGVDYVGIDDAMPGIWADYVIYGPYDGPHPNPQTRIFVRGGRLGYEAVPDRGIRQPRALTRYGIERRSFEILPAVDGGALAYLEAPFA